MPRIHLAEGELIRVFGPAALNVATGEIEVLGALYSTGERIIIHRLRSYTILALKESVLDVNLGSEGTIQAANKEDPYLEWRKTAEEIINDKPHKIMVIGQVDSGKSSVSILLSNIALNKGEKPAIIDGDVGQADIGPPGFITLSYPSGKTVWMRTLKPRAMKFIGDIKPQGHMFQIIQAIKQLIDISIRDNRSPVIIDTDGWVMDTYATIYKSTLIEEVRPDHLVVIGDTLYEIYKKYSSIGIKVKMIKPPPSKRERNREDRRYLRSEKYKEYLDDGKPVRLGLATTIISGHPLFHGAPVDPALIQEIIGVKPLYASKTPDTLYMVVQEPIKNPRLDLLKNAFGVQRIRYYVAGFEKRAYAALIGDQTDYPAMIEKIDFASGTIYLKTKEVTNTHIVRLSRYKLTEEYHESLLEY